MTETQKLIVDLLTHQNDLLKQILSGTDSDRRREFERDQRIWDQIIRVTSWAVSEIRAAGPDGIAQVDLAEKCAGRDRRCLTGLVLNKLAKDGLLRSAEVEGIVRWWVVE